jgi:hypothetical protein
VIERTESFGTLRNELRNGIKDLVIFANNIDHFATWWTWMKMEASTQKTRAQAIQINYDSLREEAVIRKWGTLKEQYVAYTKEV